MEISSTPRADPDGDSQRQWGAIFDLDGVIIDSSPHHEESWNRLARELDRALPADHFRRGFGRKNEFIIPEILEWTSDPGEILRLSLRKEALYRDVVKERSIAPLPGVGAWLQKLADARIPCAVGSSTHRENVEVALEITGLQCFFTAIISA
ncbi:MAG: HAD family phosphatase, partial [Verrucomicrobiota bacterium]|nr:HAD family phosphatase [Verrucomicrobiota bacterium]